MSRFKDFVCENGISCALEISSKELLSQHLEFSTSTRCITIAATPTITKLGKVVTHHKTLLPIKSHEPLTTWSSEIT